MMTNENQKLSRIAKRMTMRKLHMDRKFRALKNAIKHARKKNNHKTKKRNRNG